MKNLNFTEKADFPLSSTWLDALHKNSAELASIFGSVAGDCIIAGMQQEADNYYSDGYFAMQGKLYQFRRSQSNSYIVVKRTQIQVQAEGTTYTPAVEEWCEFSPAAAGYDTVYHRPANGKIPRFLEMKPPPVNVYERGFKYFQYGSAATAEGMYVVSENTCTIHFKIRGLKQNGNGIPVHIISDDSSVAHPSIDYETGTFRIQTAAVTESGKICTVRFKYSNRVEFMLPAGSDAVNGEDLYFSVTFNYNR